MKGETEAARAECERILQSRTFRLSEVQRRLLGYLVEKSLSGSGEDLKEYTVGVEALGKPPSYDPRTDSVVRVHVARLRQKLTEYYRAEGADDEIILELPKGGFAVRVETRRATAAEPQTAAITAPAGAGGNPGGRTAGLALRAALAAALVAAAILGIQLWRVERSGSEAAGWTPELRQIWVPLLSSSRPLVVCIATPGFQRIPGLGVVRDEYLTDREAASKEVSALKDAMHAANAQPTYMYTGIGTASAVFVLGQFLGPRKPNVVLTRSNLLSWPEIAGQNVIFVGPVMGSPQIQAIPVDPQIVLEREGIRNLHPRPGEPAFIAENAAASRGPEESHALISHTPGLYGNGEILTLAGNRIPSALAAAQAVTNPALARMLVEKLKNSSGEMPHYYQVVLTVESMDGIPTRISYWFHRELSVSKETAPR